MSSSNSKCASARRRNRPERYLVPARTSPPRSRSSSHQPATPCRPDQPRRTGVSSSAAAPAARFSSPIVRPPPEAVEMSRADLSDGRGRAVQRGAGLVEEGVNGWVGGSLAGVLDQESRQDGWRRPASGPAPAGCSTAARLATVSSCGKGSPTFDCGVEGHAERPEVTHGEQAFAAGSARGPCEPMRQRHHPLRRAGSADTAAPQICRGAEVDQHEQTMRSPTSRFTGFRMAVHRPRPACTACSAASGCLTQRLRRWAGEGSGPPRSVVARVEPHQLWIDQIAARPDIVGPVTKFVWGVRAADPHLTQALRAPSWWNALMATSRYRTS